MAEISEKIELILRNGLVPPSSGAASQRQEARGAYQTQFEGEGERKVKFVIDDLQVLVEDNMLDPQQTVALSIGGADGSDVRRLVDRLNLAGGVLLEYDTDAALRAKEIAATNNTRLVVEIGDATQKLDAALDRARTSFGAPETLIVLCFGVLHELPARSPNYAHDALFDRLFGAFPNVYIYCSEPCAQPDPPLGWPKTVEISLPDIASERLSSVIRFVRDRLFDRETSPPESRHQGMVRVDRDLAVEVLHKVLRFDTLDRFRHEMQERLTSFNAQELVRLIALRWPGVEQEVNYRTSGGFRKAYMENGVLSRSEAGTALPPPFTHCRVIFRRLTQAKAAGSRRSSPAAGDLGPDLAGAAATPQGQPPVSSPLSAVAPAPMRGGDVFNIVNSASIVKNIINNNKK